MNRSTPGVGWPKSPLLRFERLPGIREGRLVTAFGTTPGLGAVLYSRGWRRISGVECPQSSTVGHRVPALFMIGLLSVATTVSSAKAARAQEPVRFTQFGVIVSRWRWASQTSYAPSVWTTGVGLSATRWSGSRGLGVQIVFSGDGPASRTGLTAHGALRSSSRPDSPWHPIADAAFGFGLLYYGSGGVITPPYDPGWVPFMTGAGGLDLPLSGVFGLRAETALDFLIRGDMSPGGGDSPYLRLNLGLTARL